MRRLVGFIFMVFFSTLCFAQLSKIDSLKLEVSKLTNQEKKLVLLDELCASLYNYMSADTTAINYFKQLKRLSVKQGNDTLLSKSLHYLSEFNLRQDNFSEAEKLAIEQVNSIDSTKNKKFYLQGINQLGRVYDYFEKYEKAIGVYQRGLKHTKDTIHSRQLSVLTNLSKAFKELGRKDDAIETLMEGAKKFKNDKERGLLKYHLGYMYLEEENYDKAEEYFLDVINDSLANERLVNLNYRPLGLVYSRKEDYQNALKYYSKALKNYRANGKLIYEFDVLNNLATLYNKMNKIDSAINTGKNALKIAAKLNRKEAIIGARLTLGSSYMLDKNYLKAKEVLQVIEDEDFSELLNPNRKRYYFEHFSQLYNGLEDFRKAYEYQVLYSKLNDSILNLEKESKYAEIETKYQTEKTQKENAENKAKILQQDLELKDKQRTIWLYSAIILAGLFVGLLFLYRKAKYQLKEQKLLEAFKEGFGNYLIKKYSLKNNEYQLWLKIVDGLSEKQLAEHFYKSIDTIKHWRKSLYSKLKSNDKPFRQKHAIELHHKELSLYKNRVE